MLLAWKNAQRLEASTFLLIDSVCAPLPSVSDSARNSAITAISNAIFLLEPACSTCSACSMLSCAPMIISPMDRSAAGTIDRTVHLAQGGRCRVTAPCQQPEDNVRRGDARSGRLRTAARYRYRYR